MLKATRARTTNTSNTEGPTGIAKDHTLSPATTQSDGRHSNRPAGTARNKMEKPKYARNPKLEDAETYYIRINAQRGPSTTGLELVVMAIQE